MTNATASIPSRADQRNVLIATFLGWSLDAFDFLLLTFVLSAVAEEFGRSVPAIALTLTATLATRPLGAFVFGLLADRYGRRIPLMVNVLCYSTISVLTGLAPNYTIFFILRALYGVAMGGQWGVSASLTMESVAPKWRGVVSGFLQEGYAFGYLLAAVVYYAVFPVWGWRVMFLIGGLPAILTIFIFSKVKESEVWKRTRTDGATYRRSIFANWKIFLYMVLLLMMLDLMGHGTRDLYPTFLAREWNLNPRAIAVVVAISMLGALCGGILFGYLSDRWGRRRAMVAAVLLALPVIPLWIAAPSLPLIALGAFCMQLLVQGAFGVIPAHTNELAPKHARGFFPGFAYQLGVLCASSIGYIQALLGEIFTYTVSMGVLAAILFLTGAVVIWLGPEAKGVAFEEQPKSEAPLPVGQRA